MTGIVSRYVEVGGLRTHYLEGGEGPELILLHSGEFGAAAEICWEFNLDRLARHFHVIAPDWLGYGRSAKWFDFENMRQSRVEHITRFLERLGVNGANFAGSSMGATMLLEVAADAREPWPIGKIVVANGGGDVPDNAARKIVSGFDGSSQTMRAIVDVLLTREDLKNDPGYLERRMEMANMQGAWECTAAPRFRAPHRAGRAPTPAGDYAGIKVPALLVIGARDPLREAGFGRALKAMVPGSTLLELARAGHFPQIDCPNEFNQAVIEFLGG